MAITTSQEQATIPLKRHQQSGFGLLKSKRKAVPADFDPASLLQKRLGNDDIGTTPKIRA